MFFGIPIDFESYRYCVEFPDGRDLIVSQGLTWPHYRRDVVELAQRYVPQWASLGVRVVPAATSKLLRETCASARPQVIVLFGHSRGSDLELFDGMIAAETLAEALPEDFVAVVDLCVCHSAAFAKAIKMKRPGCLVKLIDAPATYSLWFHVYDMLFQTMRKSGVDYLEAMDQVLTALRPEKGWNP